MQTVEIRALISLESRPIATSSRLGAPDDISEDEVDNLDLIEYLMDREH